MTSFAARHDRARSTWQAAAMPRLVAEALRIASDPLAEHLAAPRPARPGVAVARVLRALAPPEAEAPTAPWLRPAQRVAVRRLVAALDRHRAAWLADPVGSGKTYTALGVAWALRAQPAVVLAPASLLAQWARVAARLDADITPWSLERASRGRLPETRAGLVIVDEAHRVRDPASRRWQAIAAWTEGRRVLLLSGTPAVDGIRDVVWPLLLGARDDTLAAAGVPSLRALAARDATPSALALLVLQGARGERLPARCRRDVVRRHEGLAAALDAVDTLHLAPDAPTRALLRLGLLAAAASSLAALHAALARYAALLEHAADAAGAGHQAPRDLLRAFVGADLAQTCLWPLIAPGAGGAGTPLCLDDLPRVAAARALVAAASADDPVTGAVTAALTDGAPTLVFTGYRATLHHLRRTLPSPVGWCTGEAAGWGHQRVARRTVLGWLSPHVEGPAPTRQLLLTDVAAEGLDLQRATRVVHVDLPWTAARLAQREGRARRLGAAAPAVEVVRLLPDPRLLARLRQLPLLARKAALPLRLGLTRSRTDGVEAPWRWRAALMAPTAPAADREATGAAEVRLAGRPPHDRPHALVAYAIDDVAAPGAAPVEGVVLLADAGARDPAADDRAWLTALAAAPDGAPLPPSRAEAILREALPALRERLATAQRAASQPTALAAHARALLARLASLAGEAARRRDGATLTGLGRAQAWAARGHTAGESMQAGRLVGAADDALLAWARRLPPAPSPATPMLRVTALLRVRWATDERGRRQAGRSRNSKCSSESTRRREPSAGVAAAERRAFATSSASTRAGCHAPGTSSG